MESYGMSAWPCGIDLKHAANISFMPLEHLGQPALLWDRAAKLQEKQCLIDSFAFLCTDRAGFNCGCFQGVSRSDSNVDLGPLRLEDLVISMVSPSLSSSLLSQVQSYVCSSRRQQQHLSDLSHGVSQLWDELHFLSRLQETVVVETSKDDKKILQIVMLAHPFSSKEVGPDDHHWGNISCQRKRKKLDLVFLSQMNRIFFIL